MLGRCPDIARPALYPEPMRLIVAALLLLCSADAMAQAAPLLNLQRGNGPEPSPPDARRCQEMPLDRHALRWLRWRD
jgi:hypothetical protein